MLRHRPVLVCVAERVVRGSYPEMELLQQERERCSRSRSPGRCYGVCAVMKETSCSTVEASKDPTLGDRSLASLNNNNPQPINIK